MSEIAVFPEQSNTRRGHFPATAGSNLTGKEARYVVLADDGGFDLPAAITDPAEYLLLEGAAAGKSITVHPVDRSQNMRVRLKGACAAGAELCLAAIAGDDAGKVRALPSANGTYQVIARAEEAGVDGQLVLCRPVLAPVSRVVAG